MVYFLVKNLFCFINYFENFIHEFCIYITSNPLSPSHVPLSKITYFFFNCYKHTHIHTPYWVHLVLLVCTCV